MYISVMSISEEVIFMLKLSGITQKNNIIGIDIDVYVPLTIEWQSYNSSYLIYWRSGDLKKSLVEIGLHGLTGNIASLTLTQASRVDLVGKQKTYSDFENVEIVNGSPVFNIDDWSTAGSVDNLSKEIEMIDEKIDFLVILSENYISILFDERKEPKKIIKSGNVLFEITDNDYLSKIHVLNLSPDEYRVLLEAIK